MQSKEKHIIAIIPARGGSRRIDKKNLVSLVGKPMITYTIEHARAAAQVDRVIVSTEDKQIAEVAREYGAEVFDRPLELATDTASSESALLHVLDEIQRRGEPEPDLVVFLQCTSPIRRQDDIDNAIRTLEQTGADSLFSAARNFGLIWAERADNIYALTYDYKNRRREQEIEKQYHENGSIYVFKPAILRSENNRLGGKIAVYEMSRWCSFQVDDADDIELVNYILQQKLDNHMAKLQEIFNIEGKTTLITGATGFFGRYLARTFLEVGARVILMGRKTALADQVAVYNNEFGEGKAYGYSVDFYNREKLESALREIVNKHDIDVLINNAYDMSEKTGFNTARGSLEDTNYETWLAAFESGIYWAVLATQIIGKHFQKKGGGSIINISSMYGLVSPHPALYEGRKFFNPPTYGVQKAGLIALTKYAASFWGRHGIRCNAIAPGPFSNTETTSANSVPKDDQFLDRLKQKTVLGRLGHPNDLRGALIYLASDASSYMTGQTLVIDGGWTIT